MSNFDKYLKLNIKMVSNETGIACVLSASTVLLLINPFMAIIIIPVILGSVIFLLNGYKKLYWTSMYKREAYLYNSLPVSAEEMVIAKISAGSFMLLMYNIIGNVLILLTVLVTGSSIDIDLGAAGGSISLFNLLMSMQQTDLLYITLPAQLLDIIMTSVFTSSLVFFVVTFAVSRAEREPGMLLWLAAAFMYFIASAAFNTGIEKLGQLFEAGVHIAAPLIKTFAGIIAVGLMYRLTVMLLKKEYMVR